MQDAVSMQVSNAAEQLMRVADYDVDGKRAVDFKEMGNRSSGHPLGKQINHVGVGVETRAQQSDRVGMAEGGCEGNLVKRGYVCAGRNCCHRRTIVPSAFAEGYLLDSKLIVKK